MPAQPLPPDRSHVLTEQRHPRSMLLDCKDVRGIVDLMIDDHAAILQALRTASPSLAAFIEDLVILVHNGGRLVYLGAGTSGRLGVLDASECPPTFDSDPNLVVGIIAGGDEALRRSSEGREDEPEGSKDALNAIKLTDRDAVLGIAAGGTTPYVLGGLKLAHAAGAMTGLLTCSPPSAVVEDCDHLIVIRTGPEVLTGSTRLKAGTATKIALNVITTTLFVRLGKVYSNLMIDLRATNQKLTDRAIRTLQMTCPELTREQAACALDKADGELKKAIVMHRLGVDGPRATHLLTENYHHLRSVIDGAIRRD